MGNGTASLFCTLFYVESFVRIERLLISLFILNTYLRVFIARFHPLTRFFFFPVQLSLKIFFPRYSPRLRKFCFFARERQFLRGVRQNCAKIPRTTFRGDSKFLSFQEYPGEGHQRKNPPKNTLRENQSIRTSPPRGFNEKEKKIISSTESAICYYSR